MKPDTPDTCPTCHGIGFHALYATGAKNCPTCGGTGKRTPTPEQVGDTPRDEVMAALERVREYVVHVAWPNLAAQEDALADISLLRTELERRKVPDTDLLAEAKSALFLIGRALWCEGGTEDTADEDCDLYPEGCEKCATGIAVRSRAVSRIIAALEQADRHARSVEEELRGKAALLEVASAQIRDLEARLNPPTYTTTTSHEAAITTTVPLVWDEDAKCFRAELDKRHTGGEG